MKFAWVGIVLAALIAHARATDASAHEAALPDYARGHNASIPVVYSEQHGSTGALGAAKARTCRLLCPSPAHARSCRIDGDADRDGEFVAHAWRSADAVVRYVHTWSLAGRDSDVCDLRLEARRTVRIVRFDGRQTTQIEFDLDRLEGRRRVTPGRSASLATTADKGVDALTKSGYTVVGAARHAGLACRVLRKTAGDVVQETCLLDDPAVPETVHGIGVRLTPIAESTVTAGAPDQRIGSAVVRLDWNARAPASLFEPPPGIRWKDRP